MNRECGTRRHDLFEGMFLEFAWKNQGNRVKPKNLSSFVAAPKSTNSME